MYDVRVVPEAIADAARLRSDEAVRRLREESRRRIERVARRALVSRCAVGAFMSLTLLAFQEARISRLRQEAAASQPTATRARVEAACAEMAAKHAAIETDMYQRLVTHERRVSVTEEERIRAEAALSFRLASDAAADQGCGVSPKPASKQVFPKEPRFWREQAGCEDFRW